MYRGVTSTCALNVSSDTLGKLVLPMRFVSPHASPFDAFNEHVSYPCPYNFPHLRFKA